MPKSTKAITTDKLTKIKMKKTLTKKACNLSKKNKLTKLVYTFKLLIPGVE